MWRDRSLTPLLESDLDFVQAQVEDPIELIEGRCFAVYLDGRSLKKKMFGMSFMPVACKAICLLWRQEFVQCVIFGEHRAGAVDGWKRVEANPRSSGGLLIHY